MRALKIFSTAMLAVLLVARAVSAAEENSQQRATSYVPRLSDLMVVIQIRHSKLFYAVKGKNWPLANFNTSNSSQRSGKRSAIILKPYLL